MVFNQGGAQSSFLGTLPVEQSLEVPWYTGPGYLSSVTTFGGFPEGYAVLPWMPTSGNALLSLTAEQGTSIYHTILNTLGRPYLDAAKERAEYYVRE